MRFIPLSARYALAASFLILAAASCKKKEDPVSYSGGQAYLPPQIGKFVEYDVDSIVYDDFSADTTYTSWKMRYEVVDSFRDADSNLSYSVNVTQRMSESEPWATSQVFYLTPRPNGMDIVMQNLRFQKLAFPVNVSTTWMGNSQIPALDQDFQYLQNWTYRYTEVAQPFDNGRVTFNNTITVMERDETINDPVTLPSAYAERTFSKAVYARDIGMVYKEQVRWTYQGGTVQALKGYSVVMRATEHN